MIYGSNDLAERVFFLPQCEESTSLADCSRYLKLPFSKANLPSNNQTLKGTKESFWITSFLCSTKLTQNGKVPLGTFFFVLGTFLEDVQSVSVQSKTQSLCPE